MTDPLITKLQDILHPVPVTKETADRIFEAVKSHIGHLAGKRTSPAKTDANRLKGKLGGGRTHKKYLEKKESQND